MRNFIAGAVFGIVVCTIGISGVAKLFDNGVSKVQEVAKDASK